MCGAGVHVDSNLFDRNIGTKKHNGGAYLQQCTNYYDLTKGFALNNSTSSFKLSTLNITDAESESGYIFYFDDPKTATDNITDIFDQSLNYTILKYATKIQNNSFLKNSAGMKGSALALFRISEL